ncbi:MAG TPA: ribonuclease H-like domain-containing protein [Candidatus Limnocylindria bacterium]|nr:ribonuclease H-like domain-containing protein [Candidatus Limnocylindria bacterium]
MELARSPASLPAMDTEATLPSLLGRRLDRLRQAAGDGPAASAQLRRPLPPTNRAAALAADLGGSVRQASDGALVVVESVVELPLEVGRLLGLPFAPPAGAPLVCLDLETTGLGTGTGTLPFLVGIGTWQGSRLTVRQFVLPDHADERAFLAEVSAEVPSDACLVTYNGKSFDWPLLTTRFRLHRRAPPLPCAHLDLLPVARQLWRHRLENARLATVERGIGAVEREHDLPGALIPERYFAYLRQRRGALLREVLEHNRQDIVSLGLLLQVLAGQMSPVADRRAAQPGDLAGLARAYARRGRHEEALSCLEAALGSHHWRDGVTNGAAVHRRLCVERAFTLARLGRRTEALHAWQELAQRGGPGAALAWLRIAAHREHRQGDFDGALDACQHAADICSRARLWGRPLHAAERDLAHRSARLRRRARSARFRSAAAARTEMVRREVLPATA